MEEVESIVLACCRLMDGAEGSFMQETRLVLPLFPDLHVVTPHAEVVESIIQNIHYVGVVFLLEVSGQVKIHGVGDSQEKNDKDGAPVAAENKDTSN